MLITPAGDAVAVRLAAVFASRAGDAVPIPFADPEPPEPAPTRYVGVSAALRWSVAPRRARAPRLVSSAASAKHHSASARWSAAPRAARAISTDWSVVPAARHAASARWDKPGPLHSAGAVIAWQQVPERHAQAGLRWAVPAVATVIRASPWRSSPARAAAAALPWALPQQCGRGAAADWSAPPEQQRYWTLRWRAAPAVRWVVHGPGVQPPEPPEIPPRAIAAGDSVAIAFQCHRIERDGDVVPVPFGAAACYLAWPRPRRYIVINAVTVVRLPERTPIAAHALTIRSSVDDLYWSLSMEVTDPAHLAFLKPGADGPKVVEVSVNGHLWTFAIESYDENREFPARRVSVAGRSQTVLLDDPYSPARARVQPAERQAQQLIDEELDLTGFTADYQTITWLVPGGVWHYASSTPIAAVRDIANAAGAVVRSHPWDTVLQVIARYPVSPWEWVGSAPDKQISDDIILRTSMQLESRPLYNYVLVSGDQVGVSDPVIRTGSAGDLRAEQVVDPLITEHAVAAERGRNVLANRGEQARMTVEIPLFAPVVVGQPGLVLPLDLVEVVEPTPWLALAIGCEIRVDVAENNGAAVTTVRQSLTLERHISDAN